MSCRHRACRAVDFPSVLLPAEAVPGSAAMERRSTSVGTEEVCAPFFWDSQIPNPSWGALASACLAGAHPTRLQHPWVGGWGVKGSECCVCACARARVYVCMYRSTNIYIYTYYIYIKSPCPWRGAFTAAAAVHIDQVGLSYLPTFSKPACKSTSICSSKSISDFCI